MASNTLPMARKLLLPAVAILGILIGYWIGRGKEPYLRTEIALRDALAAAGSGRTPSGIKLQLPDSLPTAVYPGPYKPRIIDNYLAGTTLRDVLSPGWIRYNVELGNGLTLEVEVLQTSDSTFIVRVDR